MTYKLVSETPTITAGAYSSLDAVGGKLEFENVCTPYSNSASIVRATVLDKGKQSALLYLVLFDRDFTETADNTAFTVTDADLANVLGVLEIGTADYIDLHDNSVGQLGFDNLCCCIPFELVEGGTSLFGQLMVKTSTPTYTSTSDLIIKLVIND